MDRAKKEQEEEKKKGPGRPRLHEIGKWLSLQFRMPKDLKNEITESLKERNKILSYHLSLNSFLLELVKLGMKSLKKEQIFIERSDEDYNKKVLSSVKSSLNNK